VLHAGHRWHGRSSIPGKARWRSTEVFLMEAGDSIFFDATEPHNPKNVGDTEAQLLVLYIFNAPK